VVALGLVTKYDLLRLKTLARLYARGLSPDVDWEDLLQEALTRVLVGSRTAAADVPPVAFIAGVMRSLRSGYHRQSAARQELAIVWQLFVDDPEVLGILEGLAEGLEPEQIRARLGLTATAYDTARRRMRRALLREGLASCLNK